MKERRFTLHQLMDNTPMKRSIRQQHVTLGITGAVTIFVIGTLLIWAFSLGMAPRDYIWTLVMLVPIPIVTGSAAGMLIGFVWPSRTRGRLHWGSCRWDWQ